jgi:hypothetical protein
MKGKTRKVKKEGHQASTKHLKKIEPGRIEK